MRQMYNSLPSRSLDDGDFVSVSWLSAWLSDQDKLGSLDNSSLLCQHNRLNPEKFKEIKLISSTIVKMLYIFFSGPLFFLFCNVSFDVFFFHRRLQRCTLSMVEVHACERMLYVSTVLNQNAFL